MSWAVIQGDCLEVTRGLDAASVQCVVTSPPYWGLRDYGVEGQLGLEATPEEYVEALVNVFREVRRVLRDDGTVWLNLGDSYAGSWSGNSMRPEGGIQRPGGPGFQPLDERVPSRNGNVPSGLKPKDLVGIPWRVAFALQADGWWFRSDIIWAKPNPMPESVTDRPTKAHEYVFLLSKSSRYFYDAEAVREPMTTAERFHGDYAPPTPDGPGRLSARNGRKQDAGQQIGGGDRYSGFNARWDSKPNPTARNLRSVWTIPTMAFPDAHFATFPQALVEPCVKAGSRIGDTVLDPFCGSGTAGVVALRLGRSFVGIELSPVYAEIARKSIETDRSRDGTGSLFNNVEATP